ncbi:hypothetical protein [Paenibacillus abyssi]|nr:hypothetical protein [Paenibacillus abyssi]
MIVWTVRLVKAMVNLNAQDATAWQETCRRENVRAATGWNIRPAAGAPEPGTSSSMHNKHFESMGE